MFTGLNIVYFICAVVIPVTCIITGYIMMKRPPKEINNVVGYRTRRSKQTMENLAAASVSYDKLRNANDLPGLHGYGAVASVRNYFADK